MDKAISPEIFNRKVRGILFKYDGDTEASHFGLDELMEETLVALGYSEGVEAIKNSSRWYS